MIDKAKTFGVKVMVVLNLMLVGAVIGGYIVHGYDATNAKSVQSQATSLLKTMQAQSK